MDYKTTSVSPATVWEHTTQHVCFPSAHQDHSPGRGYYVSCLYTHKSTCLLLGCIPQSRVDITRWKKQPVHLESHKSHGSWLVLYADTITLVHFTIENKWGKRASLGQCPFQSIQSDWDRTAASECSGKSTGWSHRLFQASAPCVTHQWVQRSVLCLANVQIIIQKMTEEILSQSWNITFILYLQQPKSLALLSQWLIKKHFFLQ